MPSRLTKLAPGGHRLFWLDTHSKSLSSYFIRTPDNPNCKGTISLTHCTPQVIDGRHGPLCECVCAVQGLERNPLLVSLQDRDRDS